MSTQIRLLVTDNGQPANGPWLSGVGLTPREREVLDLIATGLGNPAIATRLNIATSTVGNHITNIFAKIQVASRPEAILRARDAGLGG